ncbi:MAG: alanyl-tRNA editing protein, partial [Lachnospiraceae bacterium]|nr:alanyl-tRNA editing protein [Lachnospiraceae bacterium]
QRFDYMQQHSGEHIVSGLVHARFGYDNVGFHLGKEEVTLDFNGSLTPEQMREIELAANQVIWQNLPVNVSFPAKEVLDAMDYRSKIELTGDVRIVEIPGVDICACCAPHVETTGQIGILKVTGLQSHRGGVRVNILCGERALREFSMHQDSVAAISALLSAKQEAVADAVVRLKDEALRLKERANELQADLLSMQTALLPSPDEQDNVVLFTGELDNIALRNTVNSLCEKYKGYCCVFSGSDVEGYRFIIGSGSLDCRKAAAMLREQFAAKGGGTAPMVQGSVKASQQSLHCALEALL